MQLHLVSIFIIGIGRLKVRVLHSHVYYSIKNLRLNQANDEAMISRPKLQLYIRLMKINVSVWFRDILYCKYVFSLLVTKRSLSCSCHYKYGDVRFSALLSTLYV